LFCPQGPKPRNLEVTGISKRIFYKGKTNFAHFTGGKTLLTLD
jgi:hypothetical protein